MRKGRAAVRQATAAAHSGEAIGSVGSKEIRFRGVKKRPWGRYAAEIRDPWKKTHVWLGTFDSAEDAARVYDADVRSLRGPNAKTNCPQTGLYLLGFYMGVYGYLDEMNFELDDLEMSKKVMGCPLHTGPGWTPILQA
ncbi:hypothetical protein ACS0TY_005891 [Phlomoides rotata]